MEKTEYCSLSGVRDWRINRWYVFTLLTVLAVMILIVVLPQVDLLDTAFHRGTAPIVIHSQATARPVFQTVSILVVFSLFATGIVGLSSHHVSSVNHSRKTQLMLNHSFRC